jgi:dihydrofolate reductase
MRRLRYSVATSLDGYIARPDGAFDWIVMDPAIDFASYFQQFDTLLMGRRTFEVTQAQGGGPAMPGMKVVVISTTLRPEDHPDVTIISGDVRQAVTALKAEPGKDIWLFGGGLLFRALLDAGLVDTIELGVMPILLSDGIPVLPPGRMSPRLRLEKTETLPSGIVSLSYALGQPSTARRARTSTRPRAGQRPRGRTPS